jgi:hypothetical protein
MANILNQIRHAVFGPKTVEICDVTNPCPVCEGPGVKMEVYLDSDGIAEMLVMKCPKCGPVKHLFQGYRMRPQPRFERNYAEALTGQFKKPKTSREV